MGRSERPFFWNLGSEKILLSMCSTTSMVYIFALIKCWGLIKQKRDVQGVPFFQPSLGKINITDIVDHELHGLQFNHI